MSESWFVMSFANLDPVDLRFHHAGISVPDLEASIHWYQRVLGFELERRSDLPPVPARVAFLRRGQLRIELFQPENAKPLPDDRRDPHADLRTHGNKHVAFAVSDVRAAAAALSERGADIVFVKEMPDAAVLFLRDNAGNLIELYQPVRLET
jgi:methylmalonyl-CoA/ethylmalonyl-CoA epimerase